MMGGYIFVTIFLFLIPFGGFTPTPLDDLTINLNLNEGDEQNAIENIDRDVTKYRKRDANKKKLNDYEDGDVTDLDGGPNFESVGIQSEEEKDDNLSIQGKGRSTIQYAFRGYDVIKGSPIDPDGLIDPGYRQNIFDIKYEDGDTDIPMGAFISNCTDCDFDTTSKLISGANSYLNSLESIVNVGGSAQFEAFTAKFSASSNYKNVEKETSKNENFVTHAHVDCCAYEIKIDEVNLPPFSKSFLDQVHLLTEGNDSDTDRQYDKLISVFGTHFIVEATFGSLYGEQSIISKEGWTSLASEGIDVKAAASASAVIEFLGTNTSTEINKNNSKAFNKYATSKKKYTKGSLLLPNMNETTWLAETKENPEPINFRLVPIFNLFVDDSFGLNVTQGVINKVNQTYQDYCERLKKSNQVKSCDAPGPDRDFPHGEFTRKWKNWITGITTGKRMDKKCDDFSHVTWMQFNYLEPVALPVPTFVDLIFGCSNGTWNEWVGCDKDKNERMVGFEIQQDQDYFAIVDIRFQCATFK